MASAKLIAAMQEADEELRLDMSPMIDLVFLLLIFFMVASTIIIVQIDDRVKPPHALNGAVAENATGRIVVNILSNGEIYGTDREDMLSGPGQGTERITEYVDAQRVILSDLGIKARLHVRADRDVDTRYVKKAVQASGQAKVIDVIFGAFAMEQIDE
jgi:biopolymer transport protein ExbD